MSLIKYGEKYFDELEISIYRKRDVVAGVELNQVSISSVRDLEMSVIRGVKDKRMGIYIVDSGDENKIKEGIEEAYKLSKLNDRDDKWESFPHSEKYHEKIKVCENVRSATPDIFVNLLNNSVKEVLERDKNAVVAGAESGGIIASMHVENSSGVDVEQENSATYFYLFLSGRKGDTVTPGIFELDVRRDMNIEKERVISMALKKLEKAYNVKKAGNGESTIILEPIALGEILYFTLLPAISGEKKVKDTTPLSNQVNEKVISDKITIMDDPFHPLSVNSVIADDEGAATTSHTVFKRGIFKKFLWNSYWANIANEENTGNGIRNLSTGYVGIGAHSMVIESGKRSVDDMVGDIEHGYMVLSFQGAHSSNPDTGDFSVVANPAFVIEEGEIKGATVFMMSGNIYSLMRNVKEVSREQRPIYAIAKGIYPYITFNNVKIASVSK